MAMSGFLMVVSCWRHRLQCIVILAVISEVAKTT